MAYIGADPLQRQSTGALRRPRSGGIHQRLFGDYPGRPRPGAGPRCRAHRARRGVRGAARLRSRAARFRRGYPHRRDICEGVRQSRGGARGEAGFRQGDRRFHARAEAGAALGARLRRSGGHAPAQRTARRGDSRLHRGHPHQPGLCRGHSQPCHHAGRHVAMRRRDRRLYSRDRALRSRNQPEPGTPEPRLRLSIAACVTRSPAATIWR